MANVEESMKRKVRDYLGLDFNTSYEPVKGPPAFYMTEEKGFWEVLSKEYCSLIWLSCVKYKSRQDKVAYVLREYITALYFPRAAVANCHPLGGLK